MLENLRSLAQPHGGDLFLLLIALAVISLAVLFNIRKRLPLDQLRRVIRGAALVALLGSVFAMQAGGTYYAMAIVLLVWGVLAGLIFGKEIGMRR
ncbi:hypothetical protein [Comamonas fluminis]|jgi:predicted membrane protein|uniref:hypothetical protein n=1 Tax=Comamonas fluminis TaxID=2796366 RepID=UPI001C48A8C7|nr:hypothetical protein [Comamonas fluminis]